MSTKEPINIHDSENLLKDKFLLANLVAVTGELKSITKELLELAKSEFRLELDSTYSASDIINPDKGPEIFNIYKKYFTFRNDVYGLDYFLKTFIEPITLNVDWLKSKTAYIVNTYDSFRPYEFSDDDMYLLKKLYIVTVLDKNISQWQRAALTYLEPDYFTNGRNSRFYKDKGTRKLLSLEPFLDTLSYFDKKALLEERIEFYQAKLEENHRWAWNNAYHQGILVFSAVLGELNLSENS